MSAEAVAVREFTSYGRSKSGAPTPAGAVRQDPFGGCHEGPHGQKAAHAAGMKLAKGWQSGLGGSLALLAAQLDSAAAVGGGQGTRAQSVRTRGCEASLRIRDNRRIVTGRLVRKKTSCRN